MRALAGAGVWFSGAAAAGGGVDRHRNCAKIAGSPEALRRLGWEEKKFAAGC